MPGVQILANHATADDIRDDGEHLGLLWSYVDEGGAR